MGGAAGACTAGRTSSVCAGSNPPALAARPVSGGDSWVLVLVLVWVVASAVRPVSAARGIFVVVGVVVGVLVGAVGVLVGGVVGKHALRNK